MQRDPVVTTNEEVRMAESPPPTEVEPPLVVDLDGTLVRTDTLFELFVAAVRQKPAIVLQSLPWVLSSRARLKAELASHVELAAASLVYDERVLAAIQRSRCDRRRVILCTAADERIAAAIAEHLGLFDEVMASNGSLNLTGAAKAEALAARFGHGGFDYIGNDISDLPVFAAARKGLTVNASWLLRQRAREVAVLDPTQATRFSLRAYWRLLRPHQWIKNLLVFVPLLATIRLSHLSLFVPAALAFVSFSLVASAGYVINDVWDLTADRIHPRKRKRPVASGAVSIRNAVLLIPALLSAGLAVGLTISLMFAAVVSLYVMSTCVYTFWFKRIPILDTLALAGLYTLRIFAGAAAIVVVPSVWLVAFSMFFFLSIALAKRHSELIEVQDDLPFGPVPGRQYWRFDLVTLSSQGSAAGYAAVLVLVLFIDSSNVREEYTRPELIWLICPLLLYWISKLWLNSQRGQIREDPVVWAIRNRVSRGIGVLSVVILLLAKWLPRS